ncbi:MAG: hypothetical protein RL071_1336, partial [Pseudomonadota bacterium]
MRTPTLRLLWTLALPGLLSACAADGG